MYRCSEEVIQLSKLFPSFKDANSTYIPLKLQIEENDQYKDIYPVFKDETSPFPDIYIIDNKGKITTLYPAHTLFGNFYEKAVKLGLAKE